MTTTKELPQMASAQYASNTIGMNVAGMANTISSVPAYGMIQPAVWNAPNSHRRIQNDWDANDRFNSQLEEMKRAAANHPALQNQPAKEVPVAEKKPTRRLVQIFIADTDENVPLDKCLIYQGDQILTDLDDNELFFEVPITELLKKHNEYRVTLSDKSVKTKTVHLEPIRVRDLKMTVVQIAAF